MDRHKRQTKMSLSNQAKFFKLLGDLLVNGFSLQQSLNFLRTLMPTEHQRLDSVINQLAAGHTFANSLDALKLHPDVITQLAITQRHGRLIDCLGQLGTVLSLKAKQRQKLLGLLAYPIFIISFLGILLIFMRTLIMPEISSMAVGQTAGYSLADYVWFGLIIGLSISLFTVVVIMVWLKRQNAYRGAVFKCKLPGIGGLYRLYYHYLITFDLAIMLQSGLQLNDVFEVVRQFKKGTLLQLLGEKCEHTILSGVDLSTLIHNEQLFPRELGLLTEKGSSHIQLGKELSIFSNLVFDKLQQKLIQALGKIQPILFALIAVVIIAVYLSILLPIYSMMEGM